MADARSLRGVQPAEIGREEPSGDAVGPMVDDGLEPAIVLVHPLMVGQRDVVLLENQDRLGVIRSFPGPKFRELVVAGLPQSDNAISLDVAGCEIKDMKLTTELAAAARQKIE